jgi:hypothetical protein
VLNTINLTLYCILFLLDVILVHKSPVVYNMAFADSTYELLKDEVLLTVGCPIFPPILIAKYLFTGSLKK